jgi:hypothetical protein
VEVVLDPIGMQVDIKCAPALVRQLQSVAAEGSEIPAPEKAIDGAGSRFAADIPRPFCGADVSDARCSPPVTRHIPQSIELSRSEGHVVFLVSLSSIDNAIMVNVRLTSNGLRAANLAP